jgi:hypothetical protein
VFYCEQQYARAKAVKDFDSEASSRHHSQIVSMWKDRVEQLNSITKQVVDVLTEDRSDA